jgi:hypothetical protein
MKKPALAIVATFVVGAAAAAAFAASVPGSAQGDSVAEVVSFAWDGDRTGKQSTAWETHTSLNVTVPPGEQSTLYVRFTSPVADCSDAFARPCSFRVMVDNNQIAVPKEYLLKGSQVSGFYLEARAKVGSGQHTVRVQWKKPAAQSFLRTRGYLMVVERIEGI